MTIYRAAERKLPTGTTSGVVITGEVVVASVRQYPTGTNIHGAYATAYLAERPHTTAGISTVPARTLVVGNPAAGQFSVDYTNGVLYFDSGDAATEFAVTYTGLGGVVDWENMSNEFYNSWQKAVLSSVNYVVAEPARTIGNRHINTTTGVSSATGQSVTAKYIYEWNGTVWTETIPTEGYQVYDKDTNYNLTYTGAAWVNQAAVIAEATTAVEGVVELATATEAKTRTDPDRACTPLSLADFVVTDDVAPITSTALAVLDGTSGRKIKAGKVLQDSEGCLALGTGASPLTVTTGKNVYGIYVKDVTNTSYTDGYSIVMSATTAGDGNGALRGLQSSCTADAASVLAEIYGSSQYAIQNDGSDVRQNMYGSMAYVQVNEINEADTADGYIVGAMGIYDTPGVNPTVTLSNPGAKAALIGVVKDNANTIPHAAVMALMEGDTTGTACPAAFKAVSLRTTAGGGFTYGLDNYDEIAAGHNIITADVRGNYGDMLHNNAANSWKIAASDGKKYMQIKMKVSAETDVTGGATTAIANFFPANVLVLDCKTIITTTLSGGGVASFKCGGEGVVAGTSVFIDSAFGSAVSTLTAGYVVEKKDYAATAPTYTALDEDYIFTPDAVPTAGKIKVYLYYLDFNAAV